MNTRVVGLGAGGHAKVVIEILRMSEGVELVGLLDAAADAQQKTVSGIPVLGADAMLPQLFEGGVRHFFVGVAGARNTGPRRRVYEFATGLGMQAVHAIHPRAMVSDSARYGSGVTIMAGAIINADALLGDDVIVNSGAIVEHDCRIGDHVHIATGGRLTGGVQVGAGAHIGAGAIVRQLIKIGEGAVIAAGAVVVSEVAPHTVVAGVPARELPAKVEKLP